MWGVYVHVASDCGVHEVWPQYTSSMLSRTYEEFLQVSDLQQKHCQHGVAIQAPRASDRNPAYATRISGHESLDLLQ